MKNSKRRPSIIVIIIGVLLIFASMFFGYLMGSPTVAVIGIAIGAVMVGATGLADELGWLIGAKGNIDKISSNERGRSSRMKNDIEDKIFGELEEDDIFYEE